METISNVNAANWVEMVSKPTVLTVVYFWHPQCPWCLRLSPILGEVTEELTGRIRFFKMDVLESPASQEIVGNFGIMSTPTMLFLCKGRLVGQIISCQRRTLKKGLRTYSEDIVSALLKAPK